MYSLFITKLLSLSARYTTNSSNQLLFINNNNSLLLYHHHRRRIFIHRFRRLVIKGMGSLAMAILCSNRFLHNSIMSMFLQPHHNRVKN